MTALPCSLGPDSSVERKEALRNTVDKHCAAEERGAAEEHMRSVAPQKKTRRGITDEKHARKKMRAKRECSPVAEGCAGRWRGFAPGPGNVNYGFVRPQAETSAVTRGEDVFCHVSDNPGARWLKGGSPVTFDLFWDYEKNNFRSRNLQLRLAVSALEVNDVLNEGEDDDDDDNEDKDHDEPEQGESQEEGEDGEPAEDEAVRKG